MGVFTDDFRLEIRVVKMGEVHRCVVEADEYSQNREEG